MNIVQFKELGFTGRPDFLWKGPVGIHIVGDKFYIALKDNSNVLFHTYSEITSISQLLHLYYGITGEKLKSTDWEVF